MKKEEGEKPTCSDSQKKEHVDVKCWKLHLELKPKWLKMDHKGKKKTTTIVQDLGSDFDDETNILVVGLKCKDFVDS